MEDKRVRDLMIPLEEYATISSNATIGEALIELSKVQLGLTNDRHHHRAVLALDRRGRVVGKLTHVAVLRCLEPRVLGPADVESLRRANLSDDFIDEVASRSKLLAGGLERVCSDAARLRVADAMVPAHFSIDEHAPLGEAIHALVRTGAQSMLVTRDGDVVGVLRLSDVFEEVADLIRDTAGVI